MDRPNPEERRAKVERDIALAKHAAASRAVDLRQLMTLREFRRFVYSQLDTCHLSVNTHDITNVGDNEMIVMLWANEVLDRQQPDTITCKV